MALNVGIGIDGSKLSDMAQAFAAALVKRRGVKGDKLTAMHIVPQPDKLELVPDHLKPEKLEGDTKAFAAKEELELDWLDEVREKGMKTGEALCKLTVDAAVDFTCVGSWGRKDPDDPDHLGSTGSEPLKLMNCGCFVVKNTSRIPDDGPVRWLVSTDDSDYAIKAIKDTKSLMKEGDTLEVFFPTSGTVGMRTAGTEVDSFKARKAAKYEQMCDTFTFLLKESGDEVSDVIIKQVESSEADVLVIAHKGLTYSYQHSYAEAIEQVHLGSVATSLVRKAKCTVLITKGRVDGLKEGMWE